MKLSRVAGRRTRATFRARAEAAVAMGTPAWRIRTLRNPAPASCSQLVQKRRRMKKPQVRNTGQKNMEKNTARVRALAPKKATITPQPRKA